MTTNVMQEYKKRAVIYARFSSSNQREESITAQIRACKIYASNMNIEVVGVYADKAISGKTGDRPDFLKMIEASKHGNFDMVLVHKLDRFSRDPGVHNMYEKKLADNGVLLVSVTEQLENTPAGALMKQVIIGVNNYHVLNLAKEVQKGKKENALQAKFTGGRVPLGLKRNKDLQYEIDEEKAHLVRRIFNDYASGKGKMTIARELNEEGYRYTTGNYFSPRTIYDLLRQEKYIGHYVYTTGDGETIRIENCIPPIIDLETWYAVQKQHGKTSKPKPRKPNFQHILTGKIYCAVCGERFSGGHRKTNKYGAVYHYYNCNGKAKKNGCKQRYERKDRLENAVLDEIGHYILSDEAIATITDYVVNISKQDKNAPEKPTEELLKEKTKIKTKMSKLMDLFLDDKMNKEVLDAKTEELQKELNIIEANIRKNKRLESESPLDPLAVANYLKEFRKDATKEGIEFKRRLVNAFVDKVIIHEEEIEVKLAIDFGVIGGEKVCVGGVKQHIPPFKHTRTIKRANYYKDNLFNLNNRKRI